MKLLETMATEPGFLQVVAMGIITVFVVLICLIIIIKIMGIERVNLHFSSLSIFTWSIKEVNLPYTMPVYGHSWRFLLLSYELPKEQNQIR